MIDERAFASSFPDFWQRLLPLLTPSCVHLLNAGHEEHLLDARGREMRPIESNREARDAAIVSEFAYHLARGAFLRAVSVHNAFDDDLVRGEAQAVACDLISRYERRIIIPDASLNAAELDEGLQLATRYETFADLQGGPELCAFQVPIMGSGFLNACAADLAIGDYLVEIKTVKRSLAGKDIRQLVIYLALSNAAHSDQWQYAGFFNPRRATFHRFQTRELVDLMSGGRPAVDVYAELLEFTCSSDVELDSTF